MVGVKAVLFFAVFMAPCMADDSLLPKVHKQSGSTFMSGGAQEEQRKSMGKVAPRYPIQLVFKSSNPETDMSGVKVTMRNVSGDPILEAVSEGPHFFINPPASGRYTFDIEFNGEKQTVTKDLIGRRYLVLEFKFGGK
jgi:hypothetical protein